MYPEGLRSREEQCRLRVRSPVVELPEGIAECSWSLLGFASPLRALTVLVALVTVGSQCLIQGSIPGTSERSSAAGASLRSASHPVYGFNLSSTGDRLLTRAHRLPVTVVDLRSGRPLLTLDAFLDRDSAAILSPDGRRIAVGTFDGIVALCDVDTPDQGVLGTRDDELVRDPSHISSLAFSPDSQLLASGSTSGICLWDAPSGELRAKLDADLGRVVSMQFSPDGTHLAVSLDDGRIAIWTRGSALQLQYLNGGSHFVRGLCFLGEQTLVTCSLYGSVQEWDLANPQSGPRSLHRSKSAVTAVAASPDATHIAFGDYNGRLHVVSRETGATVAIRKLHGRAISGLAFHPGSGEVYAASHDGMVTCWRTSGYAHSATLFPATIADAVPQDR